MSCQYEEQVALAVGGDLLETEAAALERHLAGCAGCRRLAQDLEVTRQALGELAEPLPEAEYARLRARVLAKLRSPSRWPKMAAAAAALILLGAIGTWRQLQPPGDPPELTLAQVRGLLTPPAAPAVSRTARPESLTVPTPPTRPPMVETAAAPRSAQTVVKLLTNDPEVVIYWIIEETGD